MRRIYGPGYTVLLVLSFVALAVAAAGEESTPAPAGPPADKGGRAGEEAAAEPGRAACKCEVCRRDREPVAIVDGVPLSRGAYKEYLLKQFGAGYLDVYINEHVLDKYAASHNSGVTDDEVAAWIEAKVAEARSQPDFAGLDPDDLRRQYGPHARTGCLIEKLVKRRRTSEEGLRREYEIRYGGRRRARHILIRVDSPAGATPAKAAEADAAALERARELRDMVTRGADFAALARKESEDPASGSKGGELPEFNRTDVVPEFAEVAFRLKEGEVSEPTRSEFGYHLIQVTKIIPPARSLDEELREELLAEVETRPVDRVEVSRFLSEIREAATVDKRLR